MKLNYKNFLISEMVLLKAMKIMKKADIFGAQIKFNIDGKSNYKSLLGGFVTLAMTACIGFIFVVDN